jgi:hypothetical protein
MLRFDMAARSWCIHDCALYFISVTNHYHLTSFQNMKKIFALALALSFALPLSASAAINSIDGLTAAQQFLVSPGPNATNTMHMNIVNVGNDTHRFRWDGSPWRVDQGGTGSIGPFVNGGVPFYNAATNAFAQSNSVPTGEWLHWNKDFGVFEIGGFNNGPTDLEKLKLFISDTTQEIGGVGMVIRSFAAEPTDNDGAVVRLDGLNGTQDAPLATTQGPIGGISFGGHDGDNFTGTSRAYIGADAEADWTPGSTPTSLGFGTTRAGTDFPTQQMIITGDGKVGIGTIDEPDAFLHVKSDEPVATLQLDTTVTGGTSCIIMKDSDGNGLTYVTVNNGQLFATSTPCN